MPPVLRKLVSSSERLPVNGLAASAPREPAASASMAGRESLEKTIAKVLHRHCEFGWAHYYIPSEKFPSLVDELLKVLQPAEDAHLALHRIGPVDAAVRPH